MKSETSRDHFEGLVAHLLARVEATAKSLVDALAAQSISLADVNAVEVVGGSTRIAAVRTKLAEVFGKELSTTLNLDEVTIPRCRQLKCLLILTTADENRGS